MRPAGEVEGQHYLFVSDEEFDAVWLVHVKGTFWCAQAAARCMQAQGHGGVIINTCSGSHFGNFGQSNYAAAKGAIASMTYTWAIELARLGIRVNAICPVAATQMTHGLMSASDGKAPDELWLAERNSPLVVYLASDASSLMTGTHMLIDGGWTLG